MPIDVRNPWTAMSLAGMLAMEEDWNIHFFLEDEFQELELSNFKKQHKIKMHVYHC